MLTTEPQWVAIYTKSRSEKVTAQKLSDMGYVTYLPIQHKLRQWSDRWKNVEVPLIPSYIFARITKSDVVPVRSVAGVVCIVSWKGQPAIIPQSDIDTMRRMMDSDNEVYVRNTSMLKKGSRVRIVGGHFEGIEGMLVSDCENGNFSVSITGLDFSLIMPIETALLQVIS